MGGRPSKGTRADKRLRENKSKSVPKLKQKAAGGTTKK